VEKEGEGERAQGAVATGIDDVGEGNDDVYIRATTPQRHPSVEIEDGPPTTSIR
jgi:hypothetical protein